MAQLSTKVESALVRANYGRVFIKGGLLAYRREAGGVEVTVWSAGADLVGVEVRGAGEPRGDFHTAGKLEAREPEALTAWFEGFLAPSS